MPDLEFKLRLVKGFNPFQRTIQLTAKELRRRGYDVFGATDERVTRLLSTHPPLRALMDKQGFEWLFPESERARFAHVVRYHMTFMEHRMFMYNGVFDLMIQPCRNHGKLIYCEECWRAHAASQG